MDFVNVLAIQYELHDYDARNEWACKTAHQFAESYADGERFQTWDDEIKENLASAYANLENYKPWKERQEEDAHLIDQVMFALRDLTRFDDAFVEVLFGCIFGEHTGKHLFSEHWNDTPWYFWMALGSDKVRTQFLSFIKNKESFLKIARNKMYD